MRINRSPTGKGAFQDAGQLTVDSDGETFRAEFVDFLDEHAPAGAGGTSEIQRDIIAQRVTGLPRH